MIDIQRQLKGLPVAEQDILHAAGTEQGGRTRMVAWGTRIGVDVGDLELEPAWDLICTPGDQKWSRGKEGGAKSEAQQNRVDGHPSRRPRLGFSRFACLNYDSRSA